MLRSEMDRVFDSFLGGSWGSFPRLPRLTGGAGRGELMAPRMDVHESDTAIVVEAELPGIEEKDCTLSVQDGILTLKGEKRSKRDEEKEDYHLSERTYGTFQRSFQIPEYVNEDAIGATFDKGVLKITLPKRPEVQKPEKRIEIGKSTGDGGSRAAGSGSRDQMQSQQEARL
jgi:HSP20 family protein